MELVLHKQVSITELGRLTFNQTRRLYSRWVERFTRGLL